MATLDEITKEKERVGEALARVDAQRNKLADQLKELEAAERVLARYGTDTRAAKTVSARTPRTATKGAAPARGRGQRATGAAKPTGGKHGSSNLSDRVLALATGKTQQEIALHARAPAQTMLALPFLGTSGPATSKSVTGSYMPRIRLGRSSTLRRDTG